MAFVNNSFYFGIDLGCNILAVTTGMCKIASDEYFIVLVCIVDQSYIVVYSFGSFVSSEQEVAVSVQTVAA